MKKLMSLILVFICLTQVVFAFSADTTGWVDNPENASINAVELELKSDLKNDYRVYQTTITNITNDTVDVSLPTNKNANQDVNNLIKDGLSFKELMEVPKQIAVDSYKEDVGSGKVAKAHKGLIYIVSTAGAICAGAGFLGIYPQQKTEEFFAHRKIKKEYKKITGKLLDEFTLAPLEQKDFLLLVPIEYNSALINTHARNDETDVYSDFHQL